MEFAAAALSAVGTAVSSVVGGAGSLLGIGGATAGAAGGLGSILSGGGSLLATLLQGGASVAGVIGAQRQAGDQARSLNLQADDAIVEQQIERVRGAERADSLKRALLQQLGERDVAAAASGIDLSFGTPALARDEAVRDAERALGIDQDTTHLRVERLSERSSELRRAAYQARSAGRIRGASLLAQSGASILRRG